MYVLSTGIPIDINIPQLIGDVNYPAGWFKEASEREAVGIVEIEDPIPPAISPNQKVKLVSVGLVEGVWTPEWAVRDKTQEELAAEKPVVPRSVTRRQARQALAIRGLLARVESAIASLDDGTAAGAKRKLLTSIEWADSTEFNRDRPLLVQIGYAVGLDDSGLDDLFRFAATL